MSLPEQSRRFLFLQGPTCDFFPLIAAGLRTHGHATFRINLCRGDKLFWDGAAVDYIGSLQTWPAYIARFLERVEITDLVLLGEQRPYHQAAIAAARARGIEVAVVDYGYIRPDWLILERDGLGAGSRFPRDPATILALSAGLPPINFEQHYKDSFLAQARSDIVYQIASLLPWGFPQYRRYTVHHPLVNYAGTAWQLATRPLRTRRAAATLKSLMGQELHLYAMQMDTDFSIRAYSPFASNQEALEATIASFARAASPEAQLLVKVHPLDPGLRHWPSRVRAIARQFGVANRVHYLGGALHMDRTLEACRTVVTVNSTLAFRALQLGRPVLALGHALYDITGLTWQAGIDAFWRHATAPDPVLAEAFLRGVAACLQIRGTAFAQPGLDVAVRNAVHRLHHRLLNRPVAEVLS